MDNEPLQYETTETANGSGLGRRGIAVLSVKLVGVYCLLEAVPGLQLAGVIFQWNALSKQETNWMLLSVIPFSIYAAIGIVLFTCSDRLAHFLLPVPGGEVDYQAGGRDIQAIAFSVVGVVLLARGIPKLVSFLISNVGYLSRLPGRSSGRHVDLLETITELTIGLILFLRGKGLAVLWQRIRSR